MQSVSKNQGDNFPTWILDHVGTEVLLANRMAMGPGLPELRFLCFAGPDGEVLELIEQPAL